MQWPVSGRHAHWRASQGDEAARIAWAREGALLALCSARGGLVLYSAATGGRMEISDRHSRGVTCAAWGTNGRLVLGGKDQQVCFSWKSCGFSDVRANALR